MNKEFKPTNIMNKEFKGTKGGWKLGSYKNNSDYKRVTKSDMEVISIDVDGHDGHIMTFGDCDKIHFANAKLIASAPELLKALIELKATYEQLVDCGDCGNWNPRQDDCIVYAKQAINKALN